jgi:hypothetical protein
MCYVKDFLRNFLSILVTVEISNLKKNQTINIVLDFLNKPLIQEIIN